MNQVSQLARAAACLLLAAAGAHVHAQQAPLPAANPQAAVPATRYQTALGYRPEAAPTTTPDRNWVASNETVAATNSMALTMKNMGGHAGHDMAGMDMGKPDSPAMCSPGGDAGKGMQCMAGDKTGDKTGDKPAGGKMSCCQPCCCKDMMGKMNKPKEAT